MSIASETVADIERRFGNPWDESNEVGFSALLVADEKNEMSPAGEKLLDDFNLNAQFVPLAYGGHLKRIDELIEIMRAVYRHDPCLGLGYGGSSFIASCNIWAAGTEEQCREASELLLANRKLACSYYELPHGNDLTSIEFEAEPADDGETLVLNGSKQITSNVERGDAVVLYTRTKREPGSRSHSLVFVNKAKIDRDRMRYIPRFPTMGMRGVQLGGIEFDDCIVPKSAVLGGDGGALETAIKSFQITRTALPGMFIGILDTGLRVAARYAGERHLYGKTVADLPHARGTLARAFSDLLLCDSLSTVVARSIHATPGETSTYAPAVKYLVPKVLNDAMSRLAALLGANFYLRDSEYGIFQKLQRDLKPVGFGHVSRVACQMTMMPQFPRLAKRGWQEVAGAPEEVFRLGDELPPLSYQSLRIDAGGKDPLIGSLMEAHAYLEGAASQSDEAAELLALVEGFVEALNEVRERSMALKPTELTNMANPQTYQLTARYVAVLAASACTNLWVHNQDGGDPFLKGTDWVVAVLNRLNPWIGRTEAIPEALESSLFGELMKRYEAAHTFDLNNRQLPGFRPANR